MRPWLLDGEIMKAGIEERPRYIFWIEAMGKEYPFTYTWPSIRAALPNAPSSLALIGITHTIPDHFTAQEVTDLIYGDMRIPEDDDQTPDPGTIMKIFIDGRIFIGCSLHQTPNKAPVFYDEKVLNINRIPGTKDLPLAISAGSELRMELWTPQIGQIQGLKLFLILDAPEKPIYQRP
jgi:hypothetical protein